MFEFALARDIPIACGLYVALLAVILTWLVRGDQDYVVVNTRNLLWIALRLLSVLMLAVIACAASGIGILAPIVLMGLLLVLSSSFSELGAILGGPFFIGMIVFQYVLGFPASGEFILKSGVDDSSPKNRPTLDGVSAGQHATTVSPLRPMGSIQVGDRFFDASSEFGHYIETGVDVIVTQVGPQAVLVRESKSR